MGQLVAGRRAQPERMSRPSLTGARRSPQLTRKIGHRLIHAPVRPPGSEASSSWFLSELLFTVAKLGERSSQSGNAQLRFAALYLVTRLTGRKLGTPTGLI